MAAPARASWTIALLLWAASYSEHSHGRRMFPRGTWGMYKDNFMSRHPRIVTSRVGKHQTRSYGTLRDRVTMDNYIPPRDKATPTSMARSGRDLEVTEESLMRTLGNTSWINSAMHLQSELLRSSKIASGAPSVSELLDQLAQSSAVRKASWDVESISGTWVLEYTTELPAALRDAIQEQIPNSIDGVSVVMDISHSGWMTTTAVISSRYGGRKVAMVHGQLLEKGRGQGADTVRWIQGADRNLEPLQVPYLSDSVMVLCKESVPLLVDLNNSFRALGISKPTRLRMDVWRRTAASSARTAFHPIKGSISLWRFGFLSEAFRSSSPSTETFSMLKDAIAYADGKHSRIDLKTFLSLNRILRGGPNRSDTFPLRLIDRPEDVQTPDVGERKAEVDRLLRKAEGASSKKLGGMRKGTRLLLAVTLLIVVVYLLSLLVAAAVLWLCKTKERYWCR